MKDPKGRALMDWSDQPNYPRPDYLSSSRKRLAPQLLFKGSILHGCKKKIAVALNKNFFDTLPKLKRVSKQKADIAWLIYDVMLPPTGAATALSYQTKLVRRDVVYSKWPDFLIPKLRITTQNAITFLRHLDVMLEKAVVAC
jgi:hypothetical protein